MRSLLLLPLLLGFSVPAFAHNAANGGTDEIPNGWSQVGKVCEGDGYPGDNFMKLQKNSDNSLYGVWNFSDSSWDIKDVTLQEANQKMNKKCAVNSYQPTS